MQNERNLACVMNVQKTKSTTTTTKCLTKAAWTLSNCVRCLEFDEARSSPKSFRYRPEDGDHILLRKLHFCWIFVLFSVRRAKLLCSFFYSRQVQASQCVRLPWMPEPARQTDTHSENTQQSVGRSSVGLDESWNWWAFTSSSCIRSIFNSTPEVDTVLLERTKQRRVATSRMLPLGRVTTSRSRTFNSRTAVIFIQIDIESTSELYFLVTLQGMKQDMNVNTAIKGHS